MIDSNWGQQVSRLFCVYSLVFVGCGQSTTTPGAKCVHLQVDEGAHPTQVAIFIKNTGDFPVAVANTDLEFDWQSLLALDDTPSVPQRIQYIVRQPSEGPAIPPGKGQGIVIEVVWRISDATPPMLALVHTPGVRISLSNGQTITSVPATFMLRSNSEVPLGVKLTPELVEAVNGLSGWKSPAVKESIRATGVKSL